MRRSRNPTSRHPVPAMAVCTTAKSLRMRSRIHSTCPCCTLLCNRSEGSWGRRRRSVRDGELERRSAPRNKIMMYGRAIFLSCNDLLPRKVILVVNFCYPCCPCAFVCNASVVCVWCDVGGYCLLFLSSSFFFFHPQVNFTIDQVRSLSITNPQGP